MATGGATTAVTYAFSPIITTIEHTEGVQSVLTFSITATGTVTTPPRITQLTLSPRLQAVSTKSINANGTGTVTISTSSVYPWTLSFKKLDDNTVFTEDNTWFSPPNSAVFNYVKHMTPPVLTIDVYGETNDTGSGLVTMHQQYTVTATPNFSAGRDQLVGLAHASPV
jgi:hypothetical protein